MNYLKQYNQIFQRYYNLKNKQTCYGDGYCLSRMDFHRRAGPLSVSFFFFLLLYVSDYLVNAI